MSDVPSTEVFNEALTEHWHNRPPASFEDVMALYGVLAVAESGGLYQTPTKLEPFADTGRLITVSVDLTADPPVIEGFEQDALREEEIPKLAYSHKSSGRGAKYSLTQIGSKNGNDADGVSKTVLNRVNSWTRQDSVQSLTGDEGHPDGWILTVLGDLFAKDAASFKSLKSDIRERLPADESLPTVLTVKLRLDGATVESIDSDEVQYFWPADVGILQEAMQRYASANAADKNIDNDASEGTAIGLVTDTETRVVGTPESPLGVFSVKHPDAQPDLRRTDSWRNYAVAADTAMLFAKGQDLIERCVYRNGGIETYALPYFAGEITTDKAHVLYSAITSIDDGDEIGGTNKPPMAQVTFNLRENDDEQIRELAERELRFYTISMPIGDDKNIVAEEPAASTYWPTHLSEHLRETIEGPTLDTHAGGFVPFNNWPLLKLEPAAQARQIAFSLITNHTFTDAALAYRDEEGDDFRRVVDHRLLAGTPIHARTLFDEYMRRYADASEDGEIPPHQIVVQQLVQLETLDRAGLLEGIDEQIAPPNSAMTTDTDLDTSSIATIREGRLDSFLQRPLFDQPARKATALAGVLVGQISWHQESVRNIGRPLDAGTKGDQLSKHILETALTSALEKAKLYAHDSDKSYHRDLLFPETVDRLLESTDGLPTAWDIENRELQFCYVLGHAHGRRSMPVAYDLLDDEDEAAEELPTEESVAN